MNPLQRFWAWFRIGHIIRRPIAVLILVVLPMFVVVMYLIVQQASILLRSEALEKLEALNLSIADSTNTWLDFNTRALQQMIQQEEIWQMNAEEQKPILEKMVALYPYMYLVSTTNLDGLNVARSDAESNKDYSSREWFVQAKAGTPLTFQTLIGATSGQPAVVVSAPVYDDDNRVVGVGMFACDLDDIVQLVRAKSFGKTGVTYIVDNQNRIVIHPDPEVAVKLTDATDYEPVIKLRQGYVSVYFIDEQNTHWLASVTLLDNGWGVITQQQEQEIYAPIYETQRMSTAISLGGLVIVFVIFILVTRSVIQPIAKLTNIAVDFSKGDLRRRATVESRDELGVLAKAFNEMADQLQATQTNLEDQVTSRTAELESRTVQLEESTTQLRASTAELDERSTYLQTVADVSRIVATILDPDELMQQVVELVRQRFNLYYVGLFQLDAHGKRAWLKAGTGRAGQAMLARKHFIEVGTGMIGWCIENAEPRIALHAEDDVVRLVTPDLPETRSEAALPLRTRDAVIGALSIQSAVPDDFNDENISVLQLLADQVAIALDNANLYRQSQDALRSMQDAYGQQNVEAWKRMLQTRSDLAYRSDSQGLVKANSVWYPEMDAALQKGELVVTEGIADEIHPLAIPIMVRGQIVGVLDARKDSEAGKWQTDDVDLVKTVVEQLGVALESAQLYQETQNRAERERLVTEITGKLRASNDPKEILQTAASELRRALRVKDAHVLLRSVVRKQDEGDAGDASKPESSEGSPLPSISQE